MIEFFDMGKHTIFVYVAYIFSIVVLLIGYFQPHIRLKKELKNKYDKIYKKK